MRIGIDCRLWNGTGVGRYIRNLVTNLSIIDKENDYVLFARSSDKKELKIQNSKFKIIETDIHWHSISEQVQLPKILNQQNLDLVHFPYFSIPIFYYKPFVVTIHDLIVNKFNTGRASTLPLPLYWVKRIGYHAVVSNAVYRSQKIIVPSNAVRDDLLKTYLNINPAKIEVTYEGGFEEDIKNKTLNIKNIVRGKYILRVGNFYPHKNVEGLLSAFAQANLKDLKLVLVGKKDFFYERIEREAKKLNVDSNIIFFTNTSDKELISLYKNAAATIVPSFSEGFSLTAVEAMSTGSPLIASDIPVHREICQDAAIYFDPNNINDMAQKINFAYSLVDSSRQELIDQGKSRAQKFSWRQMATKTLEIYNKA